MRPDFPADEHPRWQSGAGHFAAGQWLVRLNDSGVSPGRVGRHKEGVKLTRVTFALACCNKTGVVLPVSSAIAPGAVAGQAFDGRALVR